VLAYRAVYELVPLGVALVMFLAYELTNRSGFVRRRMRKGDVGHVGHEDRPS
jgi:p-aminobenzoyl-glutamate transporter AbgT